MFNQSIQKLIQLLKSLKLSLKQLKLIIDAFEKYYSPNHVLSVIIDIIVEITGKSHHEIFKDLFKGMELGEKYEEWTLEKVECFLRIISEFLNFKVVKKSEKCILITLILPKLDGTEEHLFPARSS